MLYLTAAGRSGSEALTELLMGRSLAFVCLVVAAGGVMLGMAGGSLIAAFVAMGGMLPAVCWLAAECQLAQAHQQIDVLESELASALCDSVDEWGPEETDGDDRQEGE